MRSSGSVIARDLLVTGSGLAIIAVSSLFLARACNETVAGIRAERIGILTFKRNTAERKYTEYAIWEGLRRDTPIYNHDSIRTDDDAEAVVCLDNGTRVVLGEKTLVVLSLREKKIDIGFTRGAIATRRGEGAPVPVRIRSAGASITVRDGAVDLAQAGDRLALDVRGGSALVTTARGETVVPAGTGAVISGKRVAMRPLPARGIDPPREKPKPERRGAKKKKKPRVIEMTSPRQIYVE